MINATLNGSMLEQCAWAALHVPPLGWLNASVEVGTDPKTLVLSAALPPTFFTAADSARGSLSSAFRVVASAMGWGPIPMISAYDAVSDLPVLPWNRSVL